MYRILIVEDEALFRKSLTKVIKNAGGEFEVVGEAEDGAEALALIEKFKPHLIITDILMPVMGGMELIRNVRERAADIDIIILSGHDEFEFAKEAVRYGVEEFLLKPMDVEEVKNVIGRSYRKRQERKEAVQASGRCIIECMAVMERLADNIWSLNEQKALENLTEIFRHIDDSSADIEHVMEEARQLVNRRLEEKLRNQSEFAEFLYGDIEFESNIPEFQQNFRDETVRIVERLKQHKNPSHGILVRKVSKYICDNFSDSSISLSSVAAVFSMNESYLSSLFKNETGVTFTDYLTELRINRAKELISEGMKTSDAAVLAGYNDYPHFSRTFRKITNMSPTEYREKLSYM